MKMFIAILVSISLASCATSKYPPQPSGPSKPVNSLQTAEMLAHEAGLVVVGVESNKPEVKQQLLQTQLFRARTRDEFALVQGAQLVERTVYVPFDFASDEFKPTVEQRYQLRQLLAVADRVEVRGRTDGRGNTRADERMAHRRAEAAKRYLLNRGVPGNIIAVNYQAAGDYIADNEQVKGRSMNRRVEVEFYIDDFTRGRGSVYDVADPRKCRLPVDQDEWQVIGEETYCN